MQHDLFVLKKPMWASDHKIEKYTKTGEIIREVMWWVLKKKKVPLKHIKLIKDKYDRVVVTNVRTSGGITSQFLNSNHYRFPSSINIKFISLCTDDGWAH